MIKEWQIKVPYTWPVDNSRKLLRFRVQAKSRTQASLMARAIISKKLPVDSDNVKIKMTRV